MRYFAGFEVLRDLNTGARSTIASLVVRTSEEIISSFITYYDEFESAKCGLTDEAYTPLSIEKILSKFCKSYGYVEVPADTGKNFIAVVAELQNIAKI